MSLYQAIDVWKWVSEQQVVRYRCFKNLKTNRFAVQNADFYHWPFDTAQAASLEKQSHELFAEQLPDQRASSFDSIEEAIRAHDREFEGLG
ncbi:MAG TPA: hypothetical protein VKQ89_05855 [Candidatus Angelobacter sp.]|nr:hypothetical protein [Candidatus Angelobacter sp.]